MTPAQSALILALAALLWGGLSYTTRCWWFREPCWAMTVMSSGFALARGLRLLIGEYA